MFHSYTYLPFRAGVFSIEPLSRQTTGPRGGPTSILLNGHGIIHLPNDLL